MSTAHSGIVGQADNKMRAMAISALLHEGPGFESRPRPLCVPQVLPGAAGSPGVMQVRLLGGALTGRCYERVRIPSQPTPYE